eukprot:3864364-Pleurochrysis_carterae.AAC.2
MYDCTRQCAHVARVVVASDCLRKRERAERFSWRVAQTIGQVAELNQMRSELERLRTSVRLSEAAAEHARELERERSKRVWELEQQLSQQAAAAAAAVAA